MRRETATLRGNIPVAVSEKMPIGYRSGGGQTRGDDDLVQKRRVQRTGLIHARGASPVTCQRTFRNRVPPSKRDTIVVGEGGGLSANRFASLTSQRLRRHLPEERLVTNRKPPQFPEPKARCGLRHRCGVRSVLVQCTAGEMHAS